APADHAPDDRAATPGAWLARAGVHLKLALHAAFTTASVDVIALRGSTEADALAKGPADRLMQANDFGGTERSGLAQRMDARSPERLDRVDVSDPGDSALIEQDDFD